MVDFIIRTSMSKVYDTLPESEQSALRSENPGLALQSDDFFDALYIHMLKKTPDEVEQLIQLAFSENRPKLFKLSALAPQRPLSVYQKDQIARDGKPFAKCDRCQFLSFFVPITHNLLFRGSFGVIYTGNVPGIPFKVAIKDQTCEDANSIKEWENEIALMQYASLLIFRLGGGVHSIQSISLANIAVLTLSRSLAIAAQRPKARLTLRSSWNFSRWEISLVFPPFFVEYLPKWADIVV